MPYRTLKRLIISLIILGAALYAIAQPGPASSIFIPNTFTPNNDGNNDVFRVRGPNIKTVSINIFNQWGYIMYHADENLWDGTVKGDIVQNGTYTYLIEVTYTSGTVEKFKGQITVIR